MSDDRAMFAKADITTYSNPSIQIGWSPGEKPAQVNYLEAISEPVLSVLRPPQQMVSEVLQKRVPAG